MGDMGQRCQYDALIDVKQLFSTGGTWPQMMSDEFEIFVSYDATSSISQSCAARKCHTDGYD